MEIKRYRRQLSWIYHCLLSSGLCMCMSVPGQQVSMDRDLVGGEVLAREWYCTATGLPLTRVGCYCKDKSIWCAVDSSVISNYLSQIRKDIVNLVLIVSDERVSEYVLKPQHTINLTNLTRFSDLRRFVLKINPLQFLAQTAYQLEFSDPGFQGWHYLTDFSINVQILNTSNLTNLIVSLKGGVRELNLSQTVTLGPEAISNALAVLNTSSLRLLSLSNFQTVGSQGYSHKLNLSTFLADNDFGAVKHLDLSHNFLGYIHPGLTTRFPNLESFEPSCGFVSMNHQEPRPVSPQRDRWAAAG